MNQIDLSHISLEWKWTVQSQSDTGQEKRCYIKSIPKEIAELIAFFAQNSNLSCANRSFYVINKEEFFDKPWLRKIREKSPVSLKDNAVMQREARYGGRAIQALSVDTQNRTLIYALPKHPRDVFIRFSLYHVDSGKVDSLNISSTWHFGVKSLYMRGNKITSQNYDRHTYRIQIDPKSGSFSSKEIIFDRVELKSRVIHSVPNTQGIFASTTLGSKIITLYNQDQTFVQEVSNPISFSNFDCQGLALTQNHLYAIYTINLPSPFILDQSGEQKRVQGLIQIFSLNTNSLITSIQLTNPPQKICSQGGYTVISFQNGGLALVDILSEIPQRDDDKWILTPLKVPMVQLSDQGVERIETFCIHNHQLIAILLDGQICIWDLATKELVKTIDRIGNRGVNLTKDPETKLYHTRDIALNQNYLVLAPLESKQLELWNIATGNLIDTKQLEANITSIKFDQDYLAVGLEDGTVKFWQPGAVPPFQAIEQQPDDLFFNSQFGVSYTMSFLFKPLIWISEVLQGLWLRLFT